MKLKTKGENNMPNEKVEKASNQKEAAKNKSLLNSQNESHNSKKVALGQNIER